MEVFDRCLFQHLIGDFHLPVRPRMTEFRGAVLNAQMPAELVKRMLLIGALCFVQQVVGKLHTAVRQDMGNFKHTVLLQIAQKRNGGLLRHTLMKFRINIFGFAVDGDKQVQFAGFTAHLGNVDVDKADRILLELLFAFLAVGFILG